MILPVEFPPITTSPEYADLLSAISPCKSSKDWIYNNYIQVYADFSYFAQGDFRFRDGLFAINKIGTFYYQYNPYIYNYTTMDDFSLFFDKANLIERLKRFIDSKYYIILYLDRHLLNSSYAKGSLHNVFVYGYDDSSFKIADFISNSGGYIYTSINFSDIISSYNEDYLANRESGVDTQNKLVMFKVRDPDYKSDDLLMRKLIEDYYYERNTIESYECLKNNENALWGMSCINHLAVNLQATSEIDHPKIGSIDLKNVFLMLDHKTVMKNRLSYLLERDIIKDKSLLVGYEKIVIAMQICVNACLKNTITEKAKLLLDAANKLYEVYDAEKILLKKLLEEINK